MPSLKFSDDYATGPELADSIIKKARAIAKRKNVYFPKRVGCGGCYGSYFYISYGRNCVRELILQEAGKLGLKPLH